MAAQRGAQASTSQAASVPTVGPLDIEVVESLGTPEKETPQTRRPYGKTHCLPIRTTLRIGPEGLSSSGGRHSASRGDVICATLRLVPPVTRRCRYIAILSTAYHVETPVLV